MIFRDQFRYAFGNLRKTLLRTILTAAGVSIGIGAMTSMVSVGLGTQRIVMQAFSEGNILTSILVSPAEPSDSLFVGPAPRLDTVATEIFRSLPGVRDVYPRIMIAGLLRAGQGRTFQSLEGMPARIMAEQVANGSVEIIAGRVYDERENEVIVLSERAARRLLPDTTNPADLVGQTVSFVAAQAPDRPTGGDTVSSNEEPATREGTRTVRRSMPFAGLFGPMPLGLIQPVQLELTVVGIVKGGGNLGDLVGLSLWVPPQLLEPLTSRAFQDLESVLSGDVGTGAYSMVQVLATDVMAVRPVQDSIETMGFSAQSILDEIDQVRRGFMVMNSLLGTIGSVSLLVAAMMIVNTLVMAVLERTREIGLLKSLGATDGDVMRLFLTEAGVIGLLGGAAGLILGYVVARITNVIANVQFERAGEVSVNLVAFTPLLVLGGLAFAILVSLFAGYYPSRRAAKVDPVVALGHF